MASSNVSAVTNHFPTANEGFITTVAGSSVSAGATVVQLASVSGLTNGSVFVGIIEPGEANEQVFTGTVDTGGSQVTGVVWTRGADVLHPIGATVVDYVTGTGVNMMTKGMLVEHNQDGTHKSSLVTTLQSQITATILPLVYPVGSVYVNASVATNPATLLGFGTWTAFGSGRVLVGVDTTQTEFDTLGETGGQKTVQAHTHTGSTSGAGAHSHTIGSNVVTSASSTNRLTLSGSAQQITWTTSTTSSVGDHAHSFTTNSSGSGVNNMNPYITVHMWKRTA